LPHNTPIAEISKPQTPNVKRKATAMGTELDSDRAIVQHRAITEGSKSG
jgi:hypothetical protein